MKTYLITIKLDNGDFKLINLEAYNILEAVKQFNELFNIVKPDILQITLIY